MITSLIVGFLVYKLFGKNFFYKKEVVKAPVREDPIKKEH